MTLPAGPVTLSVEQVQALRWQLSELLHDVNSQLHLVMAAAELIRCDPETTPLMLGTLTAVPPRISDRVRQFSDQFEKVFGIIRG